MSQLHPTIITSFTYFIQSWVGQPKKTYIHTYIHKAMHWRVSHQLVCFWKVVESLGCGTCLLEVTSLVHVLKGTLGFWLFPFSLFPGFHKMSSVCSVTVFLASSLVPNQGLNWPWTETSETVRQNIAFLFIAVYLGHFASIRKLT